MKGCPDCAAREAALAPRTNAEARIMLALRYPGVTVAASEALWDSGAVKTRQYADFTLSVFHSDTAIEAGLRTTLDQQANGPTLAEAWAKLRGGIEAPTGEVEGEESEAAE